MEKIEELKKLLWELDSKYNVSIPQTKENIDFTAGEIVKLFCQTNVCCAVALLKFLKEEQQKQYADAKDYMTANQHQYYEEGCDAVLQLIQMRFGNDH